MAPDCSVGTGTWLLLGVKEKPEVGPDFVVEPAAAPKPDESGVEAVCEVLPVPKRFFTAVGWAAGMTGGAAAPVRNPAADRT